MTSFQISLIVAIAIGVVLVGVLIAVIVLGVRLGKVKKELTKAQKDLGLKDLSISELKVDLDSMKIDKDELTKSLAKVTSEFNEYKSSVVEISDTLPKSLEGKTPDLSVSKDFRACWLRLQNEALKSKALSYNNDKITLNILPKK